MTDARLSAIVVDDEPLARRELRALLAAHQELEIVGEAEDVDTAAALISSVSPDIVFLDIQLSGATGFDLLARVPARFEVVFVTAYEQHALRAFDVNALGYLLKPVSRERLAEVVARLVTRLHGMRADESRDDCDEDGRDGGRRDDGDRGDDEREDGARDDEPLRYDDRLFLRLNDRWHFVSVSAIQSILAEGNYTRLMLIDGRTALVGRTLKHWIARLPARRFLRVHRSAIVNLQHIDHVEEWSASTWQVYLRHAAEPIAMSRRYAARIQHRLG
jgi:two-component system LytT family response regulator